MERYTILAMVGTHIDSHLRQGKLDEVWRDWSKCDLRYCDLRYHPFSNSGWSEYVTLTRLIVKGRYCTLLPSSHRSIEKAM